jgi:hypothetical protein
MADFRGTILTTRGRNLLAKAQTGAILTFTKIKLGDGFWSSDTDPNLLDDLVSPKMDLPIEDLRIVGDGTVRLRFVLTNTGLSQGFFMQEIGIYAQDPDIGEILYAVAYAGERGDFIPSDGVTKVENVVDIYTVIANAQNVTAVISDTVVLATRRDIDELAQSLDNLSSQVNSQLTSQIDNLTQQLNDTASTLSNQISTVKPEAGSTAPNLAYPGKIWIDANDFLQYSDGSTWKNIKASFADTVDGFHASQTPTANTIPVALPTGKLDIGWLPDNFRRVDLTNATSDYMLQVGEEAIINFTNATSVPLRIATQNGTYYEMDLISFVPIRTGSRGEIFLNPNNTTYSNAFVFMSVYIADNQSSVSSGKSTYNAFRITWGGAHARVYIHNITVAKSVKSFAHMWDSLNGCTVAMELTYWNDTTTLGHLWEQSHFLNKLQATS